MDFDAVVVPLAHRYREKCRQEVFSLAQKQHDVRQEKVIFDSKISALTSSQAALESRPEVQAARAGQPYMSLETVNVKERLERSRQLLNEKLAREEREMTETRNNLRYQLEVVAPVKKAELDALEKKLKKEAAEVEGDCRQQLEHLRKITHEHVEKIEGTELQPGILDEMIAEAKQTLERIDEYAQFWNDNMRDFNGNEQPIEVTGIAEEAKHGD